MTRDFVGKWGYGFKEIINMSREKFCMTWGEKYRNMGYSEFRSTIKKETPYVDNRPIGYNKFMWLRDRKVNKEEYRASQLGVWDDVCVFI